MSILLITATAMEGDRLVSLIGSPVQQIVHGRRWVSGTLHGASVRLIEGGLGAVNTATSLTHALEMTTPDVVLQVGIGGAYDGSRLEVGDLALAEHDSYADLGVTTPDGWQGAELIGIPVLQIDGTDRYNTYPCDVRRTAAGCELLTPSFHLTRGPFATVQEVSGTSELGAERRRRVPGAICESMEGAAAAQLCTLYGVDFVQLRAISNLVEDRDRSRWNLPLACERAQSAAAMLIQAWAKG